MAEPRYALSKQALVDLDYIRDYSIAAWGNERTAAYLDKIAVAIKTAAQSPRSTSCETFAPGFWRVKAGSHVAFYKIRRDGIYVIRILHERMDFGRHLT